MEDGLLGDAALTWASSLSGPLGTGHALALATLPTGTHIITVTATDSRGQQAQATTTITVVDPAAQATQPVALLFQPSPLDATVGQVFTLEMAVEAGTQTVAASTPSWTSTPPTWRSWTPRVAR